MREIGYTKVRNVKGQNCHPKKEKPPRSRYLQGGFLRFPVRQSLSLWERWHATGVTERASLSPESRRAAIGRLVVGAIRSLRRAVWQHPCPLSRACARQLPQRGSPWHVGQLSSGRAKHNISETVVLRCLGQRQLDKVRCPEAAVPASKARPLASCRASVIQWKVIRPANASPFGRGGIAKQ